MALAKQRIAIIYLAVAAGTLLAFLLWDQYWPPRQEQRRLEAAQRLTVKAEIDKRSWHSIGGAPAEVVRKLLSTKVEQPCLFLEGRLTVDDELWEMRCMVGTKLVGFIVNTATWSLGDLKDLGEVAPAPSKSREATRADQSSYSGEIRRATTSVGLSNADIAWHALNTYGWDCSEVVSRGQMIGDYFYVTCSNGTRLRVYPRANQHPRITNSAGGYS